MSDIKVCSFNDALGLTVPVVKGTDLYHDWEDYEFDPVSNPAPVIEYSKPIADDVLPPPCPRYSQYLESCVENVYTGVRNSLDMPVYLGEYNTGEICVNKAGYIPLVRRIEDLERAGKQLLAYRQSVYDGHDIGDDENEPNPFSRFAPQQDIVDHARAISKSNQTLRSVQEAVAAQEKVVGKDSSVPLPKDPPEDPSSKG